jgi:hypothetical protein
MRNSYKKNPRNGPFSFGKIEIFELKVKTTKSRIANST